MGRLITSVTIENLLDPSRILTCDALVDTGASHLVLPTAWKERLGELRHFGTADLETASQTIVQGEIYGPVKIEVEGFRPISSEVLFMDMEPEDGIYEPLLGYIPLEQAQIAVDVVGQRLLHVKHLDLKSAGADSPTRDF